MAGILKGFDKMEVVKITRIKQDIVKGTIIFFILILKKKTEYSFLFAIKSLSFPLKLNIVQFSVQRSKKLLPPVFQDDFRLRESNI